MLLAAGSWVLRSSAPLLWRSSKRTSQARSSRSLQRRRKRFASFSCDIRIRRVSSFSPSLFKEAWHQRRRGGLSLLRRNTPDPLTVSSDLFSAVRQRAPFVRGGALRDR